MERRQMVATTAGVLIAAALILGAPGTGSETSADGERRFNCGNATLEGRYAVIGGGFIPGGPPPAPLVPDAHMSLMTLDGAGNLTIELRSVVTVRFPERLPKALTQSMPTAGES